VGASILCLSSASATEFPLKTADNGRFLVDQMGEPFLVIGDTAWSLTVQLDEADTHSALLATTARVRTIGFWCWRCDEAGIRC
jgi:hypothetical protein